MFRFVTKYFFELSDKKWSTSTRRRSRRQTRWRKQIVERCSDLYWFSRYEFSPNNEICSTEHDVKCNVAESLYPSTTNHTVFTPGKMDAHCPMHITRNIQWSYTDVDDATKPTMFYLMTVLNKLISILQTIFQDIHFLCNSKLYSIAHVV